MGDLRQVIYDDPQDEKEYGTNDPNAALASHIIGKVDRWEEHRDSNYLENWREYYRLWRGIWSPEDKQRSQERSRIITPALQQAIEVAVAEAEEATFGRKRWFEIEDDVVENEERDAAKKQLEQMMAQVQQLPPEQQQQAMVQIKQMRADRHGCW